MSLKAQLVIGPYRATTKPHLEGGVVHSIRENPRAMHVEGKIALA